MLLESDEKLDNDIKNVTDLSEDILRCLIFKLLEKVIDQEAAAGKLDFSSIPPSILNEIKVVRQRIQDCEVGSGTDVDKWILHKTILVLYRQLDYTLKMYHKVFYKMTAELNLTNEFSFAYETFERICDRMLKPEPSWYHIIALLCFASEVAVYVIKQGGPGVQSFLDKIVKYFMDYTVKKNIAKWISTHGGWMKMVDFFDRPDCQDRAAHIITIMTIAQATQAEKWLKGIVVVAVVTGVCLTIFKVASGHQN